MEGLDRRSFLKRATCGVLAVARTVPPAIATPIQKNLTDAFRALGFDPEAPESSWFVVTSDVHVCQPLGKEKFNHDHLAEHVSAWNAMRPKPVFAAVLGDLANLNEFFGHRPGAGYAEEKAEEGFGLFNRLMTRALDSEIRRIYVLGNHDTYPGEADRTLWRRHFPDQPPYGVYEFCGIRILKWDGGGDAVFSADQEEWIRRECAKVPKDRPLMILVHQPAVGLCGRERDIGRLAKECLAERTGVTWMLAGHEHGNRLDRWDLPGGGTLAVATHAKDVKGYWTYGVRNGQIVARVFWDESRQSFEPGDMPMTLKSKGEIPLAFLGRTDVIWSAFVGSDAERACRLKVANTGDNGGWFYYVGSLLYRFQKGKLAPTATRFAILGEMPGRRFSWSPSPCYASADGVNWNRLSRTKDPGNVFTYTLPAGLVGARELYIEYDGYGMECDDCVAGFAFLQ